MINASILPVLLSLVTLLSRPIFQSPQGQSVIMDTHTIDLAMPLIDFRSAFVSYTIDPRHSMMFHLCPPLSYRHSIAPPLSHHLLPDEAVQFGQRSAGMFLIVIVAQDLKNP